MISIKQEDFSNNYELFARLCEITSEPARIVRSGSPDLVVMNADAYMRRKKMLDLREKLLRVNEGDIFQEKGVTIEELEKYLEEVESELEK
ncbi:MAG: prevent-host-death protein [Ruminococcus sp.]|nr:prevent-host-death protein [Ruminococcus sp.]